MASDRNQPNIPPRPSFIDNEDEAIKKAIALSLVTAQQDNERRQVKYGATLPNDSMSSVANLDPTNTRSASLISRPRPQPSGASKNPPIPPRPDGAFSSSTLPPRPKKISQALLDMPVLPPGGQQKNLTSDRSSFAELDGSVPRVPPPPPPLTTARARPASKPILGQQAKPLDFLDMDLTSPSPRSHSVPPSDRASSITGQGSPNLPRHNGLMPPPTSIADKPLITFSPNMLDFDLESLDPLKDGGGGVLPLCPQPNMFSAGSAVKLNKALCTPDFERQRSASTNALNQMDSPQSNIFANIVPSIPVVPPRPDSTTNMPINRPISEPLYLEPVATKRINCQSLIPRSTALNTQVAVTNKAIASATNSLMSDMSMTKNTAYGGVDPSVFLTKASSHKKLDAAPVGWPPKPPEASIAKPPELSTHKTREVSPPKPPETSSLSRDSFVSETSSAYTIPDGAMIFHRPEPGDLMDFTAPSQIEYLSLESFDPLFSLEKSVDMEQSTDSLGLFPNPLDRLQRKNTPNPFPSVNPVTTQNLLRKSSIDIAGPSSGQAASTPVSTRPTSTASNTYEELQDPFDVPDLLKALERKRQQHAKAQVERFEVHRKQDEEEDIQQLEHPVKETTPTSADSPKVKLRSARGTSDSPRNRSQSPVGSTSDSQHGVSNLSRRYRRLSSYMQQGEESSYEILHDFPETANEEIQAFCGMVASIKVKHRNTDEVTNPGVVISPCCKHPIYTGLTVKVMVKGPLIEDPGYPFTCDVNSTVSHVVGAVLLSATDSLGSISTDNYVLKVHGLSEYLNNEDCLADYTYVQECLKLDVDIKFHLVEKSKMETAFKRTPEDDRNALFVPKTREIGDKAMRITKEKLNILMETFYKEVEKLRDSAIQNGLARVQCKSVIQCVKAICAVLYQMESIDVLRAMKRLQSVNMEKTLHVTNCQDPNAFGYVTRDGVIPVYDSDNTRKVSDLDDLHIALEEMTLAVKSMIELHCRTFHTDFRFRSTTQIVREQKESNEIMENLIVHIASACRIPLKVKNIYSEYKIICGVYHGGLKLAQEVVTVSQPMWSPIFNETLIWDEWVMFDSVIVCNLPREARLCLTLVGVKTVQSSNSDIVQKVNTPLGWVGLQLFNYEFKLTQGSQLLGLWPGDLANPTGTSIANTEMPHSILLQVNLPQFDCDYLFPAIQEALPSVKQDFESLHPDDQDYIENYILQKDSISRLSSDEGEFLWEKRHFLYTWPEALPRVIQQIGSWYWGSLTETYSMVNEWSPMTPEQALELLLPHYPDTFIREKGAAWLGTITSDELLSYLPQLVQALKFESYHTSALAALILDKAICSVRVAHSLYWLLKEAADDVCYRKRYQLMFGALLSVVGEKMRKELSREEDAVKMFSAIAEKVKASKDKEAVLMRELFNMWEFLDFDSVRLPLNPAIEIAGIDVKSCSYFTSFTFPLKLVLKNMDPKADAHYAMFKVGDDLRQDMLTMQLIDLMDKLWLKEGLDLKMVTFSCVHTGIKKGLVEIVTESDTLRRIQTKHGVGGSFKDRPIAEWLQLQNPTELEYQKAVDNFTASCAGYCVATYILGIGDRHNDNIMIKQSGHLFHIDFAKFLGDSQMFGSIKRDRVPFVLTPDMAFVINGGDKKPSDKFQHFVDLCCQAFNIIRQYGNLFINLLSMMELSGIPGVTENAGKYVQKALLPDSSDAEATAVFTRMLHSSLKSTFTQFNFFLHNLAQMKFHGHSDGGLLSFIPKTYNINQDGRIKHVVIHGIQKRYSPEKFYLYIIRVERDNQTVPNLVFRRYSEFQELHHKLVMTYPLVKLPSLHNRVILGRTHIRTVADERRAELELFLQELLKLASEISECDLIYTFFHPMLKDEQDAGKTNLQKLKERSPPRQHSRVIQGQVKLSMVFKNNLTIMVMHVKDLSAASGGDTPNPYVKLYLLPDPHKRTKRKTKIQKHTFHPTYNEMLYYHLPLDELKTRTLQITVWSYEKSKENEFLGACFIKLSDIDLTKDNPAWYPLQAMHVMSTGAR